MKRTVSAALYLLAMLSAPWASGHRDLSGLSLEELLDVEVVSASRMVERLETVPAAMTVITREDIRRSAATNIVDLLRTVPGVHVGRQNAANSSVTVRGFSGVYANRLLVLLDGRSIYAPLFGGVYWEFNDLPLDEIERIEVIRGPGASVWGANAVNGVINIITKSAHDTTGGLFQAGAGNLEGQAYLRYGMRAGDHGALRLYGFGQRHDGFVDERGRSFGDDWRNQRTGLRYDWDDGKANALTLTGSFLNAKKETAYPFTYSYFPYSAVLRGTDRIQTGYGGLSYARRYAEDREIALTGSFERLDLASPTFQERNSTYELDFHHTLGIGVRHTLQYGLAYRYHTSNVRNTSQIAVNPDSVDEHLVGAFLQDTMVWADGKYRLTLGAKIEWNEYTGVEFQPSAHFSIGLAENKVLWFAVSRAVRTPTRSDRSVRIPSVGLPNLVVILEGNPDVDSEAVIAFETGYRYQHPGGRLGLDLAAFYFHYDNFQTVELGRPRVQWLPFQVQIPFSAQNNARARSLGFEAGADIRLRSYWLLRLAYQYLDIDFTMRNRRLDFYTEHFARSSPRHQASIASLIQLADHWDLNVTVRRVGPLPSLAVDGYTEMDVRIGWSPRETLRFDVYGRNLLKRSHREYTTLVGNATASEVERGVYGRVTWQF